nr:hypothetical protein [Emticicia agri]
MDGYYAFRICHDASGIYFRRDLFLGGWNIPFPNIGSVALADWKSGTVGEWSGNLLGLSGYCQNHIS